MFSLNDVLSQQDIDRLKNTQNIVSGNPKIVDRIAQTVCWFPLTYKYAVKQEAKWSVDNVENPLKTILSVSWLCHAVQEGKLTYNNEPIRIKMDDYLEHHLWSFSLPSKHYSMCIESLYMFYLSTHPSQQDYVSPDQLRIYPALKSNKPKLYGKQRFYLEVKEKICKNVEEAFFKHGLYLPVTNSDYDPLDKVDVNEWLCFVLKRNRIDPLQTSRKIHEHVADVQALWQKYREQHYEKQKNKNQYTQPVLLSF